MTMDLQLIQEVRDNGGRLVIETNSGSTYHLSPVPSRPKVWMIARLGVEGSNTIHRGGVSYDPIEDHLIIGPWRTTGLRSIQVLSA